MPTLIRRKPSRRRKTPRKAAHSRRPRTKKTEFVLSAGEIDRINGAWESLGSEK